MEKLFRKERNDGHGLVILSAAHRFHASKTLAGKGLIITVTSSTP